MGLTARTPQVTQEDRMTVGEKCRVEYSQSDEERKEGVQKKFPRTRGVSEGFQSSWDSQYS